MTDVEIVFENDEILVINKPAGVAVQGGKDIAHPLDKELSLKLGYPVHLVHRLDRDTNGLLIVAKTAPAAAKWTKLIGGKLVSKEYIAICAGRLPKKEGTIRINIIQHGDEKNSVTHFKVLAEKEFNFEGEKIILSKIRLKLETGRMHQIRIHLAKQNCPIAGDDKHGNFKLNKTLKKNLKIKNLLLCAQTLSIPLNGQPFVISIPLPDYMELF